MVKKMCAAGRSSITKVSPAVRAAACKAAAEWEAKKAKASEEFIDEAIIQLTDDTYDSIFLAHANKRVELRAKENRKVDGMPYYIELTDGEFLDFAYDIELTEEEWEQIEADCEALMDGLTGEGGE